ncbi:MAG: hypothetical protein K6G56_07630 [Clostridiales bacterium]|nr:hypothetical protein [Clostridiales bacterium]
MAKRVIALILTALAIACLVSCGVNAVFLISNYQRLSEQDAGGADYVGVSIRFGMHCATAFAGWVFSVVALALADRSWIKWIAGILIALLVASVIVILPFR